MLIFKEMIELTAFLFAAWAVISGIDAWKRETIGKRKIQLAEDALGNFFEIRDAIKQIRYPLSYKGEGSSRKRGQNEDPEDSDLLDQAYVVIERYEKKEQIFKTFYTLKYRFMAVYGKDKEAIFNKTHSAIQMVTSSAYMLGRHFWKRSTQSMNEAEFDKYLAQQQKYEARFWQMDDGEDEVEKILDEAQALLERAVQPTFDETSKLYSLMTNPLSLASRFKSLFGKK